MLMVIFGAGASYDSSPTYTIGMEPPIGSDRPNNNHRPPLAKDLFENRPLFIDAIDAFPECRSIVPKLRNPAITAGQQSIESLLQQLQKEAKTYRRGMQELYAVRCYIQRAILGCEDRWRNVTRRITNHLSLLREIERTSKDEPVCLVTFNYDTILEDALLDLGFAIGEMRQYVNGRSFFKVFKLHGSTNWGQVVNIELGVDVNPADPPRVMKEMLRRFAELDNAMTDEFVLCTPHLMGMPIPASQGRPLFPAIAIPTEEKSHFVCPKDILEGLTDLLPKITKILIIGWRATETHFLDLLQKGLPDNGVRLYTVAANEPEAANINFKLMADLPGKIQRNACVADPLPTGFTEFMRSGRVVPFLEL